MGYKILNFVEAMQVAKIVTSSLTQEELEDEFPLSTLGKLNSKCSPQEFARIMELVLAKTIKEILEIPNTALASIWMEAIKENQLPQLCAWYRKEF